MGNSFEMGADIQSAGAFPGGINLLSLALNSMRLQANAIRDGSNVVDGVGNTSRGVGNQVSALVDATIGGKNAFRSFTNGVFS